MRAHRFDKDATKRLLEQEGIDSSWNACMHLEEIIWFL